jgi:hypothetical protein
MLIVLPPDGIEAGATYRPVDEIVPSVALPPGTPPTVQLTCWLKAPVPCTVALHWLVCPMTILCEVQATVTEVIVKIAVTVTVDDPYLVKSCVEVAVMVAVPALLGVKTPELLTVPILVGLTAQLTKLLKLPVPVTVGVQVDV